MCDTDGDGTKTPTKVVNGVWYVTDGTGGGLPGRSFGYGNVTDVPVCGDWNGDGIDTPGIVRNGAWYLTNTLGKATADVVAALRQPDRHPDRGRLGRQRQRHPGHRAQRGLVPGEHPRQGNRRRRVRLWRSRRRARGRRLEQRWDRLPGLKRGSTWFLVNTNGKPTADVSFVYGDAGDTPVTGRWKVGAPTTIGIVR